MSQVHRLATGTPERLSLSVLAALGDIFTLHPSRADRNKAEDTSVGKTATDDSAINLGSLVAGVLHDQFGGVSCDLAHLGDQGCVVSGRW